MIRTTIRAALVVACLAVLVNVGPAGAHQTLAPCNGTVTTVQTPGGTFYVDDRHRAVVDHYVYMESNRHPGYQSGGMSATNAAYPQYDGCFNHRCPVPGGPDCPRVDPDTFVF